MLQLAKLEQDLDAIQESSGECSHSELVSDLENYIEQAKNVVAQDASDTDSTGSLSSNDDDVRQKTLRAGRRLGTFEVQLVARHVDLLLQLCPSIEQVYENKHTTQLSGFRDVPVLQVTKASDSYASAVQAKFPWADQSLVQRLGEANWERHERLRNLEKTAPDSAEQLLTQDLPPPKSQFQPVSVFRDSALGGSIAPRSQSAPSAASHSSFASSKDGAERGRLRVPNMPKGISFGESFECPFCKKWLSSIRFRVDWKMHVFADLQSYVCVHNDCPDILTTFPSRKAWFEHETTCHLSRHTICCPQCDTSYEKENDFLDHCERQHNMTLRNPQLRSSALANATVSYPEKPSSIQCALCNRRGFASLRDYSTHLGRELEEVSLYPLPDLDDSDEENEDDSENESSGREITLDIARTTPSTHSSSSFSKDNGKKNAEGQDYPLDSNSQLEEEYTIKCICGFTSDDGSTVYCGKCETWQHIQCYYLPKRVPDVHYCSDCVPNNKVDAKKAHERQLRLREAPVVQDMGPEIGQIYSATYNNVSVYELKLGGDCVMRRRPDDWINATHILKIARVGKSARTRVLEREVQTGIHQKVSWGYGKFQGTWIPLDDARALAVKHGVFDKIMEIFSLIPDSQSPPPARLRSQAGKVDINHIDTQPRRPSSPAPLKSSTANAPPRAAPKDSSCVTVSTYWSVPEQRHFLELVGYYGRDFSAIASHLKTKSMNMVSLWNFLSLRC